MSTITAVDPSKTDYSVEERDSQTGGQGAEVFGILLGGAIGSDSRDELWQSGSEQQQAAPERQKESAASQVTQDDYNDERSSIMNAGLYAAGQDESSDYNDLLKTEYDDEISQRTEAQEQQIQRQPDNKVRDEKNTDEVELDHKESAQEETVSRVAEEKTETKDDAGNQEASTSTGNEEGDSEEAAEQVGVENESTAQEEGQVNTESAEETDGLAEETVKAPVADEDAGETEEVDEADGEEEVDEIEEGDLSAEEGGEEDLSDEMMQQQSQAEVQASQQQAEIAGRSKRTFSAELSAVEELANRAAEASEKAGSSSSGVLNALGRGEALSRMEHIQQLSDRFDQHVLSMLKSAVDTLTITIVPEKLGKLVVSCREQQEGVEVRVQADDPSVCNLLHEQESGIRSILDQNGFKLAEYEVSTGSGETEQQSKGRQADEKEQTGEQQRQQSAGNSRGTHADGDDEKPVVPQQISKDGVWLVA